MADTKASSTPIEHMAGKICEFFGDDAQCHSKAIAAMVREALERAPAGVSAEPVAWMCEEDMNGGWIDVKYTDTLAEGKAWLAETVALGLRGRIVPLYRAPVGGDAPMSGVARALALYEADPVDGGDRPSSWGKLDALLAAIRAALSTRSEEADRGT